MSNTAIGNVPMNPIYCGNIASELSQASDGMDMSTAMGMITTKYNTLTKMFSDAMDDEKKRQALLATVHAAKQAVQPFAGRDVNPDGQNTTTEHQAVRNAAGQAADDLIAGGFPADDPTVVKLRGIQAKSDTISSADVADALAGLDDKSAALTSDSQLNMLSLQDVVSKTQTLMSMATNLQSTFHDIQKGIVANMHV